MSENLDEFYVGYLPMPPAHLRVVRVLVVLMAVWILGLAVVISSFMRDPGDAVWDTSQERNWTGKLVLSPYPMLVPDDGSSTHLVIEMGKRGAHDRVESFDNRRVTLRGYVLQRDGRRIIELSPDPDAVEGLPDLSEWSRGLVDQMEARPALLRGEIVDGKCYLGAMKPGNGLTHKACATLCIKGGLPPMFLTQTPSGPEFRLLLVDGEVALPEHLLRFVAEPVQLDGELIEIAGIPAVRVSSGGISLVP